jgi:predicted acylesterase/phospholipase RssA
MGEPPAGIDPDVDANYRLRRMYYEQAPPPNNKMRLGYAVAASACVPGIFEPLPIVNLDERLPPDSERKIRPIVRLVDGGVHDNQGTASLLEQGCSVLLVSDASGQWTTWTSRVMVCSASRCAQTAFCNSSGSSPNRAARAHGYFPARPRERRRRAHPASPSRSPTRRAAKAHRRARWVLPNRAVSPNAARERDTGE